MIRIFMIGFSNNKGGVESYISNLCSCLDKNEFEIIYNMPLMVIDGKEWIRPQNRHNYLRYYRFWKKFYKENSFDVIYLNTCDVVSIDDLVFAKNANVPVRIIHSHSSQNQRTVNKNLLWLHDFMEKYNRANLEKYATHMFACSKSAGEWLFGNRRYQIIKNGIKISEYLFDAEKRENVRRKYGFEEERLIGIIGRITSPKNPFFALEVLKQLFDENPNIKAVFLGDGELKKDVETLARQLHIDKKIKFMGAVDNINEWLSAIDCLLMPSHYEGLPFVLVEAQASGLPCVVSSNVSKEADLTGIVEFVDLDARLDVWTQTILEVMDAEREDTTAQLVEQGYSIKKTAEVVTNIIRNTFED